MFVGVRRLVIDRSAVLARISHLCFLVAWAIMSEYSVIICRYNLAWIVIQSFELHSTNVYSVGTTQRTPEIEDIGSRDLMFTTTNQRLTGLARFKIGPLLFLDSGYLHTFWRWKVEMIDIVIVERSFYVLQSE